MDKLLTAKAAKLLEDKVRPIVITTHVNPDGDAIGSSLGLYNCLVFAGYENVSVIIPNADPAFLHWMPNHNRILNASAAPEKALGLVTAASVIFCLDFNHFNRTESLENHLALARGAKILIDHHPEPSDGFDVVISDTSASSTAELVYEFLVALQLGASIDRAAAECLYAAIVTDTGSFSYGCNSPRTYEIMAELMKMGIDGEHIHRLIYSTYSENRLRLLGHCLSEKLVVMPKCSTAYISLSRKEMNRFHHKIGDTEGVVNYPLSIQGISLAALFTENKDHIKISFRSSGPVDVNELARLYFNGGGHINASGGKSFTGMEETVKKFEAIVNELYCKNG